MKKILLVFIICPLVFCSCLSIDRKINLNKDGSGQETIKITFSKEFYGIMSSMTSFMDSTRKQGYLDSLYSNEVFVNKTKGKYDSIDGVKIINISSETNPDSSNTFVIEYNFDSIKSLSSSLGSLNEDNDNSQTDVTWLSDGSNILFRYSYNETPQDGVSADDSLSVQMKEGMSEMFGSGRVHFEIEFPYEVTSSNATSSDGNKLMWDYPMSEIFMTGKMNLEAVLKEN